MAPAIVCQSGWILANVVTKKSIRQMHAARNRVNGAKPQGCHAIKGTHHGIRDSKSEERGGDEAEGREDDGNLQASYRGRVSGSERDPCAVDEPVGQKENRLKN